MTKWRNVLVAMVLCVGLLLVCVPQADAAVNEPYWQVDEYSSYDGYGSTDVWFGVTNQHASDALAGFAVTINPEIEGDFLGAWAPYPGWRAERIHKDTWNLDAWSDMTTSTEPGERSKAQDFFGGTWDELFGDDSDFAIMFWSKQNVTSPDSIPAGDTWGNDEYSPFSYTYGYEGGGWSIAAIRMQSGYTTHGDVDTPNPFPAGGPVIPEPATITLLGLGLIGAALRRRRK